MGSSTHSVKGLDRKSLKRPDNFMAAVNGFFDQLASQSGRALVGVGLLLAVGLAIGFWMNHKDSESEASRSALFLAEKSLETEMKAMAAAEKAASSGDPAKVNAESELAKKEAPKKEAADSIDLVLYKKFDVNTRLSKSVELLKAVDQTFTGTRAAIDARLKLGGLYFNHGEYEKAISWYQKAADTSSGFERAMSLSSLGYAYENLGKFTDAVQAYEKALNLGEGSLKGDLLLGIARSSEAAHDTTKARNTYDQILKDLPNTEYAQSAEIFKGQLQ